MPFQTPFQRGKSFHWNVPPFQVERHAFKSLVSLWIERGMSGTFHFYKLERATPVPLSPFSRESGVERWNDFVRKGDADGY